MYMVTRFNATELMSKAFGSGYLYTCRYRGYLAWSCSFEWGLCASQCNNLNQLQNSTR
jgi:hypothetical protein